MFRRCALALGLIVAAGCAPVRTAPASPEIQLAVERSATSPGDSLVLVLENSSGAPVGYNLCASGLERRQGGEWQVVPSDRVCTMELRTLSPGAQTRYPLAPSPELPPGEYRAVTGVERLTTGERLVVVSEPFRVPG
jgi:hypothetical protein